MKVFVYRNLARRCWSIKALDGEMKGRVIGHASSVLLSLVSFKVNEKGRQRVIRDKRKNVHAGAVGRLQSASLIGDSPPVISDRADFVPIPTETCKTRFARATASGVSISYNPYEAGFFFDRSTGDRVDYASMVALAPDGKVFARYANRMGNARTTNIADV